MPSELTAEPEAAAAPAAPVLLTRFTATERWLHWVHTAGFTGMLVTGLLLYLPGLTGVLGSRPGLKAAHLVIAALWVTGLVLVVLLGNRRALRTSLREIDGFTAEDREWLRHGRTAPQDRFNAGQKLHTVLQVGFAALFVVSGTLLWLGERRNELRLPGTIAVHDLATLFALALLLGHLWLALAWPPTRHAMRGILRGTVRADWAAHHHVRGAESAPAPPRGRRPGRRAIAVSVLALLGGTYGAVVLARDATRGEAPSATAASTASQATPQAPLPAAPQEAPPPAPGTPPLQLAGEAQQLLQAGDADGAVVRFRRAVRGLPARADIRTGLGVALAQSGNTKDALAQLRRAVRARPVYPDARLYLGAVLNQSGQRADGRAQLRRYLKDPGSAEGAALAQQLRAG